MSASAQASNAVITYVAAAPVTFSGKTDMKTTAFALGAPIRVDYTTKGSGNFSVDLTGVDGTSIASIANRIGAGSATTWVYGASGKGYFDVTADGAWTIMATAVLPALGKLPATFRGSTDLVTAPVEGSDPMTVAWTVSGSGNFTVDVVDPADGSMIDSVANLIGQSKDSTQLYGDSGPIAFDITADGAWTLLVTAAP
ncbi:MAG: hypothetical protein ACXWQ6_02060 [Candidatus Limnocylindrales bacterium]